MNSNDNNVLKDIMNTILEIKIAQVKHESHQDRMNEILAKLTDSVEYHIKRSDNIEELIAIYKRDSDERLTNELAPIKSHISFIKGSAVTLSVIGAVLMGLHSMGILQKLF